MQQVINTLIRFNLLLNEHPKPYIVFSGHTLYERRWLPKVYMDQPRD